MHQAIISLGSNLGNRLELLQRALALIEKEGVKIKTLSSIYETPAWGFNGSPFYNACALIETSKSPKGLLSEFFKIEEKLGRFRKSINGYSARQIDLDLLFYEDNTVSLKDIKIPHPRLHLRNFILVPLVEIAPQWYHPVLKKTSLELLLKSPDKDILEKLPFKKWRPPIFDTFSYIIIEGNIGVGKTTLAQKIASDYKLSFLKETFAENPYLEKFYNDPVSYSLPVEQFFLKDRMKQTNAFWNQNKDKTVSDFNIQKSLIFARKNLNDIDFKAYKREFNKVYPNPKLPDIMVYLHNDIETLKGHIKKRGRYFEQNIKNEYLEHIELGYKQFIKSDLPYPVISIHTKNLNFQTNEADYQALLRIIFNASFS